MTKKLTKRTSTSTQKMDKYEIQIIQKKGPYPNKATAEAEKKFIKKQVSHCKFSQMTGSATRVYFEVLHDYTEKFPVGTSTVALEKAFKAQSPSVKSAKVRKL